MVVAGAVTSISKLSYGSYEYENEVTMIGTIIDPFQLHYVSSLASQKQLLGDAHNRRKYNEMKPEPDPGRSNIFPNINIKWNVGHITLSVDNFLIAYNKIA
jgi:hypothetical protein